MKLDRNRINEARPTLFHGIVYRSQTEARWAVFFHHMDIVFKYEEEDFNLDGLLYRPDFWLVKQNCWLEVKGPFPTQQEKEKARRLAVRTTHNVYLSFGDIPEPNPANPSWYSLSSAVFFPDGSEDEAYWWCECPHCGTVGLQSEARAAHLPCGCLSRDVRLDLSNHYYSPRLLRAYLAAREAEAYRESGEEDSLVVV
jgi:hypothetical protein